MTTTLRHHSPLGPIVITGVRGLVAPDTDFEVPDHIAARLLDQDDVYELVDGAPAERSEQTYLQLRHALADRGLPTDGKKADLLERVLEADRSAPDPIVVIGDAPQPTQTEQAGPANSDPQPGEPAPAEDADQAPAAATDDPPTVDEPTEDPTPSDEPATGQEGA